MAFYLAPRFARKLAVHITKNYLDLPDVNVPLILGVHGRKGEGKTFQCRLAYEAMGLEVVRVSSGELESPDAGDPARMLRLRYREAAEMVRVRGKMAILTIDDLDAGAGRVDQGTQYTVNTQLVNATLMHIADNPTNVQLPGSYDSTPLQRIPIIVTGNDFATLYAPLVRDGRMEKFYWEPTRDEKLGIVKGIFAADSLADSAITQLVDRFSEQSVDFFGALRARLYDEQVALFIEKVGYGKLSAAIVNSKTPPQFSKPDFSFEHLIEQGQFMELEQRRLQEMRLGQSYTFAGLPQAAAPVPTTAPSMPATPVSPPPSAKPSGLAPEIAQQVQSLVDQGHSIGIEYADPRRYRSGSWQSCRLITAANAQAAAEALSQCLQDHKGEYVRMYGASKNGRVNSTLVQRP